VNRKQRTDFPVTTHSSQFTFHKSSACRQSLLLDSGGPTTLISKLISLGWSAFARRYLRNLFDFFSSGYLDVSVHQVPSTQPMYSAMSNEALTLVGFPHSDTSGSTLLCSSPERFAAYASFIGSLSLGIRRTPLVAYFVKQHLSSARCNDLQITLCNFQRAQTLAASF